MSRLRELNQALIAVIVRYSTAPTPPGVEDLSDKPVADIYTRLDNLIDLSTQAGSVHSLLLRELLDNIITLAVFMRPVNKQAISTAEELPRPLHEQLIRGQKIPTHEELRQQLSDLVIKTQALVATPPQDPEDFYSEFVMIQHDPEIPEEPRLPLETLLQEELFLTLGLRPKDGPDKILKQITTMLEEHQEFTRLVAENRRQSEEIRRQSEEIRRQAEEIRRLSVETKRPNAPQRHSSSSSACRFPFASQLLRTVSGLAHRMPILPIFNGTEEVVDEQPAQPNIKRF